MDPAFLFAYHRDLVAHERRLLAFREAITRTVRPGDVVVDVGAGTGILSVYAARAGAERVYAIERTMPPELLRQVLKENGVADKVRVLPGDSRAVELPETCDLLIAEIGLDEESLLDARTRFLRPGGRAIPEQVEFWMAPVQSPETHGALVTFWAAQRAGVALSRLRDAAANQVHRTSLEGTTVLADPTCLLRVDLARIDAEVASGSARFAPVAMGIVHGFAGWHRVKLGGELAYDNAPPGPAEGYGHHFFPLDPPLPAPGNSNAELTVMKRGAVWTWRGRVGERRFDASTFANLALARESRS